MSNPRQQAHDAAGWYFSHIDPYNTNQDNIRNYLRRPLIAVTSNSLQESNIPLVDDYPPPTATLPPSTLNGTDKAEEEEKKSGGGEVPSTVSSSAWKEFLPSHITSAAATAGINNDNKIQEAYEGLSRRTKARMEAFLAGCTLAIPSGDSAATAATRNNSNIIDRTNSESSGTLSLGLQDGLTGFHFGASPGSNSNHSSSSHHRRHHSASRSMSTVLTEQGNKFIRQISKQTSIKHPQIEESDLILRLELYIKTLQRVKSLGEECVVAMEPPKIIKLRAQYLTHDFVATAGCVRDLSPVLTRLLNCVTMELLAVECLPDKIQKAVRRITMKYEHETSFASFAFLSTPEVNATSQLTPLILKYLKFLQSDWENLVSDAKLEFMLSHSIDTNLRRVFKTIEFQSIGHLLEVCHEFRSKLHNIELAPDVCAVTENINSLCNSKEAIRQALRDLQREVITVNGHVLPPVTSRKDLLHLLKQTLNSRSLTAPPKPRIKSNKKGTSPSPKTKSRKVQVNRSNSCPHLTETPSDTAVAAPPPTSAANTATVADKDASSNEDSDVLFSSTEYDSSERDNEEDDDFDDVRLSSPPPSPSKSSSSGKKTPNKTTRRRRNFHLSTIDLLTRRLLIAASRTGNGGDAYFIVRDLFGGEGVEVVPTNTVPMQGRMVRPGTIDILVRLASVTIKCHQSFDVYPRELVGEVEPLIQLHTTTTECISLKEVRSFDSVDDPESNRHHKDDTTSPQRSAIGDDEQGLADNNNAKESYMVVQEQKTDTTGWRTISVRPALYEKIEVWNTPS